MKKNLKGITLIELLVVLAIISILALVAYAGLSGARDEAKKASMKASMDSLIPSAEVYYMTGYTYVGFTVPAALTSACTTLGCSCATSSLTATTWTVACNLTSPAFTWTCANTGTQTYCY